MPEPGFAPRHLAIIGFMIFSGQVQQTMQRQNAQFERQTMPQTTGLPLGRGQRDRNIAQITVGLEFPEGKSQHVGRPIMAAVQMVPRSNLALGNQRQPELTADATTARQSAQPDAEIIRQGQVFPALTDICAGSLQQQHWRKMPGAKWSLQFCSPGIRDSPPFSFASGTDGSASAAGSSGNCCAPLSSGFFSSS